MDNNRNKKQSIGLILIVIYCCVISTLLFLFIPEMLAYFFKLVHYIGILIILVLAALAFLIFVLTLPVMKLSKTYLHTPNKAFAIICGLIVGLPMTIILTYYSFGINYYSLDGFTELMIVVSGGILPFIAIFYTITDPKNFVKG